jgi:acetate kinase
MAAAVAEALAACRAAGHLDVDAVGHRVVHGGPRHASPARIDPALRAELSELVALAPLHEPAAIAAIDAAAAVLPDVPAVACFDTAFHATMPVEAARWALPIDQWEAGVRRYGFHGLSYEYVVDHVGAERLGRSVVAHLGHGASMCAVAGGRSVDTTMGLTPTGGIVMGTRSGDLDPGVVVHLLRHSGLDVDGVDHLLNHRSGLLGLSGTTSDMRRLLAAAAGGDDAARLAVDVFCRAARKQIGAYAAVLGGLDTLVFTGGIGERAAAVRAGIVDGLGFLGLALDPARNRGDEPVISPDEAPVTVLVVPTDEQRMIARHTARVVDRVPEP